MLRTPSHFNSSATRTLSGLCAVRSASLRRAPNQHRHSGQQNKAFEQSLFGEDHRHRFGRSFKFSLGLFLSAACMSSLLLADASSAEDEESTKETEEDVSFHSAMEEIWAATFDRPYKKLIYSIIGLNSLVWCAWQAAKFDKTDRMMRIMHNHFTDSIENVKAKRYHSCILSAFSHMSFLHLAVNMYLLDDFGKTVYNDVGGTVPFLQLYGAGAVTSSIASLLFKSIIKSPAPSLGASGALYGMVTEFALSHPDRMLSIIFFPFFAFPALKMLGVVLGIESLLMVAQVTRFDHAGHIGGAVGGYAVHELWKSMGRPPPATQQQRRYGPPKLDYEKLRRN